MAESSQTLTRDSRVGPLRTYRLGTHTSPRAASDVWGKYFPSPACLALCATPESRSACARSRTRQQPRSKRQALKRTPALHGHSLAPHTRAAQSLNRPPRPRRRATRARDATDNGHRPLQAPSKEQRRPRRPAAPPQEEEGAAPPPRRRHQRRRPQRLQRLRQRRRQTAPAPQAQGAPGGHHRTPHQNYNQCPLCEDNRRPSGAAGMSLGARTASRTTRDSTTRPTSTTRDRNYRTRLPRTTSRATTVLGPLSERRATSSPLLPFRRRSSRRKKIETEEAPREAS